MFGISIDNSPDSPVGTPATRRAAAIHWNWTTEYTHQEIADALGVTTQTIRNYLNDSPNQEVKDVMGDVEAEVRLVAVAELKEQLRAAGSRSRTAEKPVKIWAGEDGSLHVNDKVNPETGELTGKYPVPHDIEIGADEEARFYARSEVREILDQLVGLTGAGEPDRLEVEGGGVVIHTEADDGDG